MPIDIPDEKLIEYLDKNAAAARTACWVAVGLDVAAAAFGFFSLNPFAVGLGLVNAALLFWLLVKSRPASIPPAP